MMRNLTKITNDEIEEYRKIFTDRSQSLEALELICELEGNLEESTSLLALQDGVRIPRKIDNILEMLAQKYRKVICDELFDDLLKELLCPAVVALAVICQISEALATPIIIYIVRIGIRNFCDSNEIKNQE